MGPCLALRDRARRARGKDVREGARLDRTLNGRMCATAPNTKEVGQLRKRTVCGNGRHTRNEPGRVLGAADATRDKCVTRRVGNKGRGTPQGRARDEGRGSLRGRNGRIRKRRGCAGDERASAWWSSARTRRGTGQNRKERGKARRVRVRNQRRGTKGNPNGGGGRRGSAHGNGGEVQDLAGTNGRVSVEAAHRTRGEVSGWALYATWGKVTGPGQNRRDVRGGAPAEYGRRDGVARPRMVGTGIGATLSLTERE